MKLEYDKDVDAAYVCLDAKNIKSTKTVEINENIILDLDKDGKIMGIEILNASKVLNKRLLSEAMTV